MLKLLARIPQPWGPLVPVVVLAVILASCPPQATTTAVPAGVPAGSVLGRITHGDITAEVVLLEDWDGQFPYPTVQYRVTLPAPVKPENIRRIIIEQNNNRYFESYWAVFLEFPDRVEVRELSWLKARPNGTFNSVRWATTDMVGSPIFTWRK